MTKFQSTRPVWGATRRDKVYRQHLLISIHAPRVGRDLPPLFYLIIGQISIPAPRVGRDETVSWGLSSWEISIHAPRVGRDNMFCAKRAKREDFNPRAPCGARPMRSMSASSRTVFQSTRPVWGATCLRISHTICILNFNPRAPCGARRNSPAYAP